MLRRIPASADLSCSERLFVAMSSARISKNLARKKACGWSTSKVSITIFAAFYLAARAISSLQRRRNETLVNDTITAGRRVPDDLVRERRLDLLVSRL